MTTPQRIHPRLELTNTTPTRCKGAMPPPTELPAFEIFDAEQNKIFDTNEDMPSEIQEANARLASARTRVACGY